MKKISALILSALLASVVFSGCEKTTDGNRETLLPEITVGVSEYEPYYYTDENGETSGIDVEICRQACERIGYEPVFKEIDWTKKDKLLEDGSIDCIWTCFSMNGRENEFKWAGPYASGRQVVAVLEKSDIYTLGDLKDKKICVQMNSVPEKMLSGENRSDKVFCLYDVKEIASALRREYADACISHEAALISALKEAGVNYRILDEPLTVSRIGVAFSKNDTRGICEKLHRAVEEMKKDGTIEKIYQSYGVDCEAIDK